MRRGAGGIPRVNPGCIPAVILWGGYFCGCFFLFCFLQTLLFKKKGGRWDGAEDALTGDRSPGAGSRPRQLGPVAPSRRLKINKIKPNSCQLARRRVGLGLAAGPAFLPLFRSSSIYFSSPPGLGGRRG